LKGLNDEELRRFDETGSITVNGHLLTREDIHLSYVVDSALSKYHAHSNGKFLVLLDTTPSQEMLDEGLAREVINKIQKLRKRAGLQPSDKVDMLFELTGNDEGVAKMERIVSTHKDNIQSTTKGPLFKKTAERSLSGMLGEDNQKMKGVPNVSLHLWVVPPANTDKPKCRYVNIELFPDNNFKMAAPFQGCLLLENPQGRNFMTYDALCSEANSLLGFSVHRKLYFYYQGKEGGVTKVTMDTNLVELSGSTIFVSDKEFGAADGLVLPVQSSPSPYCSFINVSLDGESKFGTVLLENPKGHVIIETENAEKFGKRFIL
jgi:isoleucyl-tRNA synthetase